MTIAMLLEISSKAKHEATDPSKSKTEIGMKRSTLMGCFKRV